MDGSEIELIYSFSILTLNKKQLDKLDHHLPFDKEKVVELFLKDISIIKTSPVKTIKDCLDFANEDSRLMIRKSFWGVPGIYMIKYKFDDRLFYIGRAVNLSVRLRDHFIKSRQYTNRLGRFITAVGWENLSVHILEVCSEEEVEAKENNYIKEYLPTLNGKFSSSYSNQVYRTLSKILAIRQGQNRLGDKPDNINKIWVYSINNQQSIAYRNLSEVVNSFKMGPGLEAL